MEGKKVLIVGCGDIGNPLGAELVHKGAQVWGIRRNPASVSALVQAIEGDVTKPETLSKLGAMAFDYVVVTLTPAGFTDEAYRHVYVDGLSNLLLSLGASFTGHLVFVSSTSVYHQNNSEWVDEDSDVQPVHFSGQRLLDAERLLNKHPMSTVVRFAGIYGPGRLRLINQVRALNGCPEYPVLYTNRIHRDDCVGFLLHLITCHYNGTKLDNRYLGVDNMPATMYSVKRWLAQQLGIDVNTLDGSGAGRRTSKRCNNQRMKDTGYQLLYPDYKSGYIDLIQNAT